MRTIVILITFMLIGACSSKFVTQSYSPDILFKQVEAELSLGEVNKAITTLRKLDANYSFNEKAIDAQVLLIWIYYKKGNLDQAEVFASNFLKYYPYNKYTPWVEYVYALTIYQSIPSQKRDIAKATEALGLFKDFIQKYPNLEYAEDLNFRTSLVKDILANRVMEIGRYYLRHKVYVGAINRFKEVIYVYNNSIFVPEALYRLTYSSLAIGLDKEALLYYRLLKYNYSSSKWYTKANHLVQHKIKLSNSVEQ